MGRKLTEKEKVEREIKKIMKKIQNFEKIHDQDLVKSACYRYINAIHERKKAEKDIRDAEKRLADAKRRLGK